MATVNLRTGHAAAFPAAGNPRVLQLERYIDFAVNNVAAADVVQLFDLKKGQVVLSAQVEIVTGEAGSTFDLGVSTSGAADQTWINEGATDTTGAVINADGSTGAAATGLAPQAVLADTVVTFTGRTATLSTGKVRVKVLVWDPVVDIEPIDTSD
jgi:hypothetical protein